MRAVVPMKVDMPLEKVHSWTLLLTVLVHGSCTERALPGPPSAAVVDLAAVAVVDLAKAPVLDLARSPHDLAVSIAPHACGDHWCDGDENCTTCPLDCGCGSAYACVSGKCQDVCGNRECTAGESCATCPTDCGCERGSTCEAGACQSYCGNGACGHGEDCNNCPADCGCASGKACAYWSSGGHLCTSCGTTSSCRVRGSNGEWSCDPCTQTCDCTTPS